MMDRTIGAHRPQLDLQAMNICRCNFGPLESSASRRVCVTEPCNVSPRAPTHRPRPEPKSHLAAAFGPLDRSL
jgi:hypothetical protein